MIVAIFAVTITFAQPIVKNATTEKYIEKYHKIAESNMREFGIPASITLAQGVLESGSGQSQLAKKSNNHFGIKCKSNWAGGKVFHDDDEKGECFRKYESVEDSYADHATFLSSGMRYASLFLLKKDDYKGWATGLSKAGYATNPKYAQIVINTIETYELHKYDSRVLGSKKEKENAIHKNTKESEKLVTKKQNHVLETPKNHGKVASYVINNIRVYKDGKDLYIISDGKDNFELLSKKLKVSKRKLTKINKGVTIANGERIYISKKRTKK